MLFFTFMPKQSQSGGFGGRIVSVTFCKVKLMVWQQSKIIGKSSYNAFNNDEREYIYAT